MSPAVISLSNHSGRFTGPRASTGCHNDQISPFQGHKAGTIQALAGRENVLKQRTEGGRKPERRGMEFHPFVSAANPYADVSF